MGGKCLFNQGIWAFLIKLCKVKQWKVKLWKIKLQAMESYGKWSGGRWGLESFKVWKLWKVEAWRGGSRRVSFPEFVDRVPNARQLTTGLWCCKFVRRASGWNLETRRLLGGLWAQVRSWRFLPECGPWLASVWVGSCRTITCFVFFRNREGITSQHIVCNNYLKHFIFSLSPYYCILGYELVRVVWPSIKWYQSIHSLVVSECVFIIILPN